MEHTGTVGAVTRKVLLEGPPGVGKTTVVRRLVDLLREAGIPLVGFTTRELREQGRRVGFAAHGIGGPEVVIAHVGWTAGPSVGRYRVDVAAFERLALPAMRRADDLDGIVVIDELGRMELASAAFVNAVGELFERDVALCATVHVFGHPFTDELKRHPDVQRIEVTPENRKDLPARLLSLFAAGRHTDASV